MFKVLEMGAGGLMAQRVRMETIAQNILNTDTTRNARGEVEPYQRRFVVLNHKDGSDGGPPGVQASIHMDSSPPTERYQPGHPDADSRGMVLYPSIDLGSEYVNAMEASRAYEANVTLMEVTKQMINATLRLLA